MMRGIASGKQISFLEKLPLEKAVNLLYHSLKGERPSFEVFKQAMAGYIQLKQQGHFAEKDILTVIDFQKPSTEKRLWVIDLATREILMHDVVAHGRNSGNLYAEKFSNTPESYMSSLGFYATGEKYHGKHGLSLRLDGLQKGLNDKARERAIVIHGADYAEPSFAAQTGRLGRSLGCPAVPPALTESLIETIADNTCLFIYFPEDKVHALTSRAPSVVDMAEFLSQ